MAPGIGVLAMTVPPGYIQLRKRFVRLYRMRACEALRNARLARDAGDQAALQSCLVALRFWRRSGRIWARKIVR